MEILPNIGIGSVRFGMSPDEVIANFKEQQQYEDWMGGNLNDSLLYHGIILGFDKCNSKGPLPGSRLVEVRLCRRENAQLWGQLINQLTRDQVIDYLNQKNISHRFEVNGDLSVYSLNLALSFDEENNLEYIEFWELRKEESTIFDQIINNVSSYFKSRA